MPYPYVVRFTDGQDMSEGGKMKTETVVKEKNKNWCSCLELEKDQREFHNHTGYPCLRFRSGHVCSAERIDHQKWVPMIDGDEVGRKCYRTSDEAIGKAIDRAAGV